MDGWHILDVILCVVVEHLRHISIVLRNTFLLGLIYVVLVGQSMLTYTSLKTMILMCLWRSVCFWESFTITMVCKHVKFCACKVMAFVIEQAFVFVGVAIWSLRVMICSWLNFFLSWLLQSLRCYSFHPKMVVLFCITFCPQMMVRFICPVRTLRFKVKYFRTKCFVSRSLSTPRFSGAFWNSLCVWFEESYLHLLVQWSTDLDLAKVRNTNNHFRLAYTLT
jgi:hypothetical protein